MSVAGRGRVEVLLVGLPGFYEWLLRRELASDRDLHVTRLEAGREGGALPADVDMVIVAGAAAPSLHWAGELVRRGARVLGTVAVTDEEPRGDVYVVSPAGANVTRQELADVIREVARGRRPGVRAASDDEAEHDSIRGLTRSDP